MTFFEILKYLNPKQTKPNKNAPKCLSSVTEKTTAQTENQTWV